MYAIIYWDIKDGCYPLINDDGTLWTADLDTADARANNIDLEVPMIQGRKVDGCRVISIESVHE